MILRFPWHLHPITRKRMGRFREIRRAHWSFWILVVLYGFSLMAELVCNSQPLYVRYEGRSYFPVFRTYAQDDVLHNGIGSRVQFKQIVKNPGFRQNADNRVVWPLISYGPLEIIQPDTITVADRVHVDLTPDPRVGSVDVREDFSIARSVACGFFFGREDGGEVGLHVTDSWEWPPQLIEAVNLRLRNESAPGVSVTTVSRSGLKAELSMAAFSPRSQPPRTVRLTFSEPTTGLKEERLEFDRALNLVSDSSNRWNGLAEDQKARISAAVGQRFKTWAESFTLLLGSNRYKVSFIKEDIRFPFRPVEGHPLGIDSAGRDVLARTIYGFRTSMTFGLLLVIAAMVMGTLMGALQGYYGGRVDIVGQRLVEIWDALPFLYILMLMGSVFGRRFSLLLVVYGLFNWIGISYYMRAEFLRLRKLPFVEAALCLGLPSRKIIFRHILPNALVPIITFFPFSLIGAISVLAALDFLGFGLPPPTASWGELLSQAQEYTWAWWLVLYPSLALFFVMLLCVFIGEGVRSAFDPRKYSRME